MIAKLFNGFRVFIEQEEDDPSSSRDTTLANKLNIKAGEDEKMGAIPASMNAIQLKAGDVNPEDPDGDTVMKYYKIIRQGANFATVEDVTGRCDRDNMNNDNVMAQCSRTHGQVFTLTGKGFDLLRTHVAGQAAGGMGGMPMGGGGMPPPMGGGAGGAPPPPPI